MAAHKVTPPEWLEPLLLDEARRRGLSVSQLLIQFALPHFNPATEIEVPPVALEVPGGAASRPGGAAGATAGDYRGNEVSSEASTPAVEVSSSVEVSETPGKKKQQSVEPPEQSSLPGVSLTPLPAARVPPGASRARSRPAKAPPPPDPAFDRFFAAYPRRKARAPALVAWTKLRAAGLLPPLEVLLAAVEAMCLEGAAEGRELRHYPHPATWLNAQRWTDHCLTAEEVLAEPVDPEAVRRADRDREREAESERLLAEQRRRVAEIERESGMRLVQGGRP